MKLAIALLFVGLTAGCAAFGGDMPIRLTGTLPQSSSSAVCTIGIALARPGEIKARRSIAGTFETTFVVEAKGKSYRFVASCDDGWSFESAQFTLGGKGSFNKRIDLGVLK